MSIILRPADSRGHADHGWLDTRHSFSFADYYDPRQMGYRSLRVINDDVIHGGGGFPTHGHRDMEIITYVIEGGVAHRDTSGGSGLVARGDVQVMSAGAGIRHSEFNASATDDLHLLQIWLLPNEQGLQPTYAQARFGDDDKRDVLRLIASPNGESGALPIHQDARLYASILSQGATLSHALGKGRGAWIQVISGSLDFNGTRLGPGDGAAAEETDRLTITATSESEFLLFDLA
jgi:redox-sensitive bicupin YhaK (pirin superfamily)